METVNIKPACDLRRNIYADFDQKCVGKQNCQFSVLASYQELPECQVENDPHFLIAVECRKDYVNLPGDSSVSRHTLAIIVCIFDLLICVWVSVNISLQDVFIKREDTFVDDKYLQMTDFTVRIKGMPPQREYHSLPQLKAQLSTHLAKVVSGEKQVLEGLDGAVDKPGEIVSIHFGHKKFNNYKKLMQIAQTAKKG